MKRVFAITLVLILAAAFTLGAAGCKETTATLNILNWGDYINPDVIAKFEEETGISVNYSTLSSNEEMMIKLRSSDCVYDLCFPSDYIIEKLIAEDLLYPLNMENIPNAKNIAPWVKETTAQFDPGNTYSLPYMWGTVGILYNTTMVDDTVDSWDILWNEKYAGNVIMYDSVRDSIAVSLLRLGYDINTRSEEEVAAARDALIYQKQHVLQSYGTDDNKAAMINGRAAFAVVYSGDAVYCIDENPDLAYCVPKEGSNVWFDNVIIPKTSANKEAAEKFIDFLCRADMAKINTEYICYSSPNAAALELLDADFLDDPTYNPPQDVLDRCTVFHDLGEFVDVFNDAWEQVKMAKVD